MVLPDPDPNPSRVPDAGVKKAPDLGSATLFKSFKLMASLHTIFPKNMYIKSERQRFKNKFFFQSVSRPPRYVGFDGKKIRIVFARSKLFKIIIFCALEKMSKGAFLQIFIQRSSKSKCNFYTWIQIQQLKLMRIRILNPTCGADA